VEIKLFGTIEILRRSQEGPVSVSLPPASRSLLVWLLLHRGVPALRETLAFQLFPDDSEKAAFANLRRHIHILTRKLTEIDEHERWIVAGHQTLCWNDGLALSLDVNDFERACASPGRTIEATRLYRGDLASDMSDAWIEPHRNRLRERFAATCFHGAAERYRSGEPQLAMQIMTAYLRQDPWHEDAVRTMILLRARSGDPIGALQQADAFRDELAREMGVEPSTRLLAAASSVRDDRYEEPFGTETSAAAKSAAPKPSAAIPHNDRSGSYGFCGRDAQLQDILAAIERADAGGTTLLVTGSSGIGKSRLAREVLDISSQRGARTLSVTCAFQSRRPHGPLLEMLSLPDTPQPVTKSERESYVRGISGALRDLCSERKAVIVIDDAQWADGATIELLRKRNDAGRALPNTILLYRTGCEDSRVQVGDLQAMAGLVVELGPLDRDSLKTIASQALQGLDPSPEVLDGIADVSVGNPLFAQELARYTALRQTDSKVLVHLPASISASVHRRLSEFETPDVKVLETAAVIGAAFSIDLLVAVAPTSESDVRQILRRARDLGFLKPLSAGSMAFTHAALHEAILSRPLSDERANMHRAIARELARQPERLESLSELAYHWQEAGEGDESCKAYFAAGNHARQLYALRDALDFYDSALRHDGKDAQLRTMISLCRAETQLDLGLVDDARRSFEDLLRAVEADGRSDAVLHATILLRLSACEWSALRRQASLIWASRAFDTAGNATASAGQRIEATVTLARAAVLRGDAEEALAYLDSVATETPSDVNADLALSISGYRGLAYGMLGREREAIHAVSPSDEVVSSCKSVPALAAFRQNQGITFGWFGRFPESRQGFDDVVDIGRRTGNKMIEAIGRIALGHMAYYTGDFPLARSIYEKAASLALESPGVATFYCAALGLKVAAASGDADLAESLASDRLFSMCESDDILFVNTFTGALIDYTAAFGDVARARVLLKSYISNLRVGAGLWYVMPSVLYLGDADDLAVALALAQSWSASGDNPLGTAFVAMLSAAKWLGRGSLRNASAECFAAIPTFERLGIRYFVRVAESLEAGALIPGFASSIRSIGSPNSSAEKSAR
jgi:DNA-binding SARP family transcriptional activator/tetratricopeptide (TPR) repeat protein